MKGLLIKDFRLMFQRKRSFLMILLCGFLFCFSTDAEYFVGWLVLIGAIFALSTIAYDEHDNCYPFLMTLPVTKKGYAIEKYVFGMLCGAAFWVIGVVFYAAAAVIRGTPVNLGEKVLSFLMFLLIPLLILDITIPVNLKFGSEKIRLVMRIIWGVVFGGTMAVSQIIPGGIRLDAAVLALPPAALTALTAAVMAALTGVSVCFSIRVMSRKEF